MPAYQRRADPAGSSILNAAAERVQRRARAGEWSEYARSPSYCTTTLQLSVPPQAHSHSHAGLKQVLLLRISSSFAHTDFALHP